METFIVQGQQPIKGKITPAGNKNEALPAIAACLLTRDTVTLHNVPAILDIQDMFGLLTNLGVSIEYLKLGSVRISAKELHSHAPEPKLACRIRGSILLLSPLLARLGEVVLTQPGGDRIGSRRLETHFIALKKLGASLKQASPLKLHFQLPKQRFKPAEIFLDECSVTATENTLMAAASTEGETIIDNAASEPHIQGLCHLLTSMGATITGQGSNRIHVQGTSNLHGCEYRLQPDHTEIGSLIGLAAATGSELTITNTQKKYLHMICLMFQRLGVTTQFKPAAIPTSPVTHDLYIPPQKLVARPDTPNSFVKIDSGPWPLFPSDLTSIMAVVATQCQGSTLIFEKMFENRLFWIDRLLRMGAQAVLCDPHRVLISGQSTLRGALMSSPDIRAGMALLIAALAAQGESEIQNIHQIDRGYERIDQRLNAIGANIQRKAG